MNAETQEAIATTVGWGVAFVLVVSLAVALLWVFVEVLS